MEERLNLALQKIRSILVEPVTNSAFAWIEEDAPIQIHLYQRILEPSNVNQK